MASIPRTNSLSGTPWIHGLRVVGLDGCPKKEGLRHAKMIRALTTCSTGTQQFRSAITLPGIPARRSLRSFSREASLLACSSRALNTDWGLACFIVQYHAFRTQPYTRMRSITRRFPISTMRLSRQAPKRSKKVCILAVQSYMPDRPWKPKASKRLALQQVA